MQDETNLPGLNFGRLRLMFFSDLLQVKHKYNIVAQKKIELNPKQIIHLLIWTEIVFLDWQLINYNDINRETG